MNIGIDGNEANVDKKVGVSVYTLELLNYFQKKASKDLRFTIFLKHEQGAWMPEQNEYYRYEVVKGKIMWSQIFLPWRLIIKRNIDIFFAPAHYVPRYCPVPYVVTIHDLSFFYYPDEFQKMDLYQLKNWTEYSVRHATQIIAVSKTTKKDITKFYEFPDTKIKIIYNGFEKNETEKRTSNIMERYELIKDAYILYVGTVQPRKNIPILLRSFAQFQKNNPEYKLVLVGKKGWLYEPIFEEADKLKLKESIIFTGYLPDKDVVELYKNAFCFVLPSLYEGFGIPVLEAMSYSCPVISSHASSLPEIGGDACLYFDPKDEKDLLEKFVQLAENKSLHRELVSRGKKRVQEFSWEKCAEETLQVFTGIKK